MDKLKTKIRNVFKGSKTKKGFSLMELIVVIAIMVIMLAVLAPSLIHYVEDTRAKKDTSASSEMTNAVTMGLTNQDVYDELIKNSVKGNVSCYIDRPTEEGYEKIESSSKYTFDNNARLLDEVPYHPAGNMYGVTITFEPKQKSNGSDTEYSLKDGIVNKYVPEKTQLLTENENLYAALRKVVGEKVELNSQTYRNSELTIFVQVGSRKGSDIITTDAVEVYSQFSGTNLPADTEIEYIPTTDRVIDYVYKDPDEPIGGGTGGSGTLPDGGGSGTTGGNTEHTHSYEKQVTSPTCQNQGYTTYVCTCGDSYVDEESYVDKVGHSYTSTIEKYATCTATGTKSLRCSICGHNETAEIAKLGHSYKDDVIEATCTTNGYTVHTCSRCGDTYQDNQTVAGGHQWSDWTVTKEANCKNEGLRNRKCNLCGHQENETISALGHSYNNVVTEPTCTTEGYTTHTCSKCGDVYTDSKTDKKNHTFGDWTTNKEPSCEVAGERFRICTTCSQTEYSTIDQLGHDYKDDYTTDVAATCTTVGRKSQHCSRCNSTRNNVEIPALGHDWNSGSETIKPTCESAGTKVYTCNICGATKSEDLNATGHNYKETVTPPTTTSEGYTLHTCLNCGLSYKDNFVDKIGVSITGTVKIFEELTEGVIIQLKQNDNIIYSTTTDNNGEFAINDMYVGEYSAVITYKEINQWTQNIHVIKDSDIFDFSFILDPGLYDSENNLLISWENLISMDYATITWGEYIDEDYNEYVEYTGSLINIDENGVLTTSYSSSDCWNSSWSYISGEYELENYYVEDGCGYVSYDFTTLVVPEGIKAIGDGAFGEFHISRIYLPDTIKSLGKESFYSTELTKINIPESVTSIGEWAFAFSKIHDFYVPKNVNSIGVNAFYAGSTDTIAVDENNSVYDSRNNCNAIIETDTNVLISGSTNTIIPENVTKIESYAFYDSKITSVDISENVKGIGYYAFGRSQLESINIEYGLEMIDKEAFFYTNIESIVLPNSITSVGEYAFKWCFSLTNATISQSLSEIPNGMFSYCNKMTTVDMPNNITRIGDSAFDDCYCLTSIIIPNGVLTIGERSFETCKVLKSIEIPNTVEEIGRWAFSECYLLEKIIIPGSVQSVGMEAFERCSNLKEVEIQEGVKSMGSYSFDYCSKLEKVHISSTVNIGYNSFINNITWYNKETGESYSDLDNYPRGISATYTVYGPGLYDESNNLMIAYNDLMSLDYASFSFEESSFNEETGYTYTEVTRPILTVEDGVLKSSYGMDLEDYMQVAFSADYLKGKLILDNDISKIGNSCFTQCAGLTDIEIKNSVTEIGSSAFYKCTSITNMDLPDSLKIINSSAFSYSGLTSMKVPNSVTTIGESAFSYCENLEEIVLSDNLTSIENYTFNNCKKLETITIPKNVTNIAKYAFSGCNNISHFDVDENNQTYCDVDGVIFTKDMKTLVKYPVAKQGTEYVIPTSVEKIADAAFAGCTNLTSIDIPSGVTSIGANAFASCSNLNSIVLPNGITAINDSTFYGCKSLTTINIPNNVTSIGYSAFYNCSALTSVEIPTSVLTTGESSFRACSSLKMVTLNEGLQKMGRMMFWECTSLESIVIPNSVTSMQAQVFYMCTSLKEVTIGTGITIIDQVAFQKCTSLETIVIPANVKTIQRVAFYECTNLKNVYIESTSMTFYDKCFYKTSGPITTFYFRNSTVRSKLTTSYYNSSYGTKSTNYSW